VINGHCVLILKMYDNIIVSGGGNMLRNISSRIVDRLLNYEEFFHYDRAVYVYGIELIISTLAGLSSIIGISILCSNAIFGIVFILFFVPLRLFTGGYHAKTYSKCYFVSILSFVILLSIQHFLETKIPTIFWLILFLIAQFYIMRRAPMINRNQEISSQKERKSKTVARIIIFVEGILVFSLAFVSKRIMSMAVLSVWLVVTFMLLTDKSFWKGV